MDPAGGIAVVTGGCSGIGAAAAAELRRAGATAVVWDVAAEADVRCDVADPSQVDEAMRRTVAMRGIPGMVVAAAGVGARSRPVLDLPAADVARCFQVNVYGVLYCLQAAARHMVDAGISGSIVVVSSANGTVADEGLAAYSMSKVSVNMLVRVMARELGSRGIRVNAVAPGPIATPMLAGLTADPAYLQEVERRTPLGGVGTAESVGAAIVNLLRSDWVTGAVLPVDGGSSLHTGRSAW